MRTVITRKTLGVSWDERTVQACLMRSGLAEVAIERLEVMPRERGADGKPLRSAAEDVADLVERIGAGDETCVTCLSESEVMYRTLARPFADRKKIAETIGPEVETLLPALDSRLLVDFVLLGREEGGLHVVQALAARSASVEGVMDVCRASRLEPEVIDCASAAVAAGARSLLDLPQDRTVVVVHMGWSESSVAILAGKTIRSLGALPMGFERIAPRGASPDPGSASSGTEPVPHGGVDGGEWLNGYFREILIMLEKCGELEGGVKVLATGYARHVRDFEQRILESSGITPLSPGLKDVEFDGNVQDVLDAFLSVSLACRGSDSSDAVNFHQGQLGLTKRFRKLTALAGPWLKAAALLLVIWIAWLSTDVFLLSRTNKELARKMNEEYSAVMPKGTPMVEDQAQYMEQYLKRISGHAGGLDASSSDTPLEILKGISEGIPGTLDVVLDSINIEEEGITLTGNSANYEAVEKVQEILAKLPNVKEVKIVSTNVDKNDSRVKMKLVCKR